MFQESELVRDLSAILTCLKDWLEKRSTLEAGVEDPDPEALEKLREECESKMGKAVSGLDNEEIALITGLEKPLQSMNNIKLIIESFLKYRVTLAAIPQRVQNAAGQSGIQLRNFSALSEEIRQKVEKTFENADPSEEARLLRIPFFFINTRYIDKPLYIYDDTNTKKAIADVVRSSVEPQYRTVKRGSAIVSSGNVVLPSHILQLTENARRSDEAKTSYEKAMYYLGDSAIIATLAVIFALFLRYYRPRTFFSNSRLAAVACAMIIPLALSKAVIYTRLIHPFLSYPVLTPFAAVVIALMFTVETAYIASFILAALTGLMFDFSLSHAILALGTGIAASHYSAAVRRRSDLARVGLMTGSVSLFLTMAISIAANADFTRTVLWQGLGGFFFSAFGVALATLALPLFEHVFKVSTNISLMELTDTKNPLIKRLIMETPGTYHHSLVVGNLAEAAAEDVGANPLLARVGAYYHDIGKLKKPEYFSENEKQTKSKHDSLIPSMSSLIIVSHVKEGVDLAIKHKLPKEIIDIVRQHHGSNLVYYFYKRAMELGENPEDINENDFRYPGPKPQNKETAIIMLADSVEAASRSLDRVSSSKITSLVHDIIISKFGDGQLDECELTLKDLHKIEQTFTHILMGSLHQRVKYPKEGEKTTTAQAEQEPPENEHDRAEEQSEIARN